MALASLSPARALRAEWPTLGLLAATYAGWAAVTAFADLITPWAAVPLLALLLAQHSSLQHEVLHGHPFRPQWAADLLVLPAVGLAIPYERFRDLHLAHHHDPLLTDPYDDPESQYLEPAVWARQPRAWQAVLLFNNTLIGRMLAGPAIGLASFWGAELRAIRAGDRAVIRAWALHAAGLIPVLAWAGLAGTTSLPAYLLAAYLALSLLKIRTFLEHRAHERPAARTVVIGDRGPLALLFLNNNFHAVHHAHPAIPWYRLPAEFARRREEFLKRNDGYFYPSYAAVFARHLLRRKEPVAHPAWPLPGPKPEVHPVSGRPTHRP